IRVNSDKRRLLHSSGRLSAADLRVIEEGVRRYDDAEQSWRGVFEVTEPASKHWVEIIDDPSQAVASAAARQISHLVLERLQALLAHQPAACLKPVAQEIEPLSRLAAVAGPRLVWVQGQAVGRGPRLDLAPGGHGIRFRPA